GPAAVQPVAGEPSLHSARRSQWSSTPVGWDPRIPSEAAPAAKLRPGPRALLRTPDKTAGEPRLLVSGRLAPAARSRYFHEPGLLSAGRLRWSAKPVCLVPPMLAVVLPA